MQQQVVNLKEKKTTRSRFSRGMVLAVSTRIFKVHNEDAWLVKSGTIDDK
jgi:tRNA-binding EMAP/Myf-like protein